MKDAAHPVIPEIVEDDYPGSPGTHGKQGTEPKSVL